MRGSPVQNQKLSSYVADAVSKGWRLEQQTDSSVSLLVGRPTNHLLHFFIGVFTCGLWWAVWLIIGLTNKQERIFASIDESGEVKTTRVAI
jgi:hypothetical protein